MVNLNKLGGGVIECFQSKQSSRQPLQFPHLSHQNFSLISVVDSFGRIICQFFMTRVLSLPHTIASHWLHVSVSSRSQKRNVCSIRSANYTTFARGCRRRCTGFLSVAAWCLASSEMQYSFSVPNGPFIVFDLTLWQVTFEQQGLSPFSSLLYILTVYRNLTYLIQYLAEQA